MFRSCYKAPCFHESHSKPGNLRLPSTNHGLIGVYMATIYKEECLRRYGKGEARQLCKLCTSLVLLLYMSVPFKKLLLWLVLRAHASDGLPSHYNAAHTKRWIKGVFSRVSPTMHAFLRLATALYSHRYFTDAIDFVGDLHLVSSSLPHQNSVAHILTSMCLTKVFWLHLDRAEANLGFSMLCASEKGISSPLHDALLPSRQCVISSPQRTTAQLCKCHSAQARRFNSPLSQIDQSPPEPCQSCTRYDARSAPVCISWLHLWEISRICDHQSGIVWFSFARQWPGGSRINHCFAKPGFLCRTGLEPRTEQILAQSSKANRHAVLPLPYV